MMSVSWKVRRCSKLVPSGYLAQNTPQTANEEDCQHTGNDHLFLKRKYPHPLGVAPELYRLKQFKLASLISASPVQVSVRWTPETGPLGMLN